MDKRRKNLIICFCVMLALGIGYQRILSNKASSNKLVITQTGSDNSDILKNSNVGPAPALTANSHATHDSSPSESSLPNGNGPSKSLTPDSSAPDLSKDKGMALSENRSPASIESNPHSPPQIYRSGDLLSNSGKRDIQVSDPVEWYATSKAAKDGAQLPKEKAQAQTRIGSGFVVPFSPSVTGGEQVAQNPAGSLEAAKTETAPVAGQKSQDVAEKKVTQQEQTNSAQKPTIPGSGAPVAAIPSTNLTLGQKIGKIFGFGKPAKTADSAKMGPPPAPVVPNTKMESGVPAVVTADGTPLFFGPGTTAPGEQQAKAPEGCFTVSYKHENLSSHNDGELCAQHKNLIALPLEDGMKLNSKSICVRVNGTPVKFGFVKGSQDKLVVGSVAGPNAVISARYCTASISCNEDCNIPKDDFLSAIGGNTNDAEDDDLSGPVVQWDPSKDAKNGQPSKVERELERELASFKTELKGANLKDKAVFMGWQTKGRAGPACQGSKVSRAN